MLHLILRAAWGWPTGLVHCHGVQHPNDTSPLETLLASPLRGVQRGSITGLQGMEGTSLGGGLVFVSACLTVSPLITREQAHTQIAAQEMNIVPGLHSALVCISKLADTGYTTVLTKDGTTTRLYFPAAMLWNPVIPVPVGFFHRNHDSYLTVTWFRNPVCIGVL
jgi:hypothetical protein